MELKCIGGMCHGQRKLVESYRTVGDLVQVMAEITYKISDFNEELDAWRKGKVPESMTIPYYYYKIEVIHFSEHEYIKFLIPVDWTSKQALSILLLP